MIGLASAPLGASPAGRFLFWPRRQQRFVQRGVGLAGVMPEAVKMFHNFVPQSPTHPEKKLPVLESNMP